MEMWSTTSAMSLNLEYRLAYASATTRVKTWSVDRHFLRQAGPVDQWTPHFMSAVNFKGRAENYRACCTRLVLSMSLPTDRSQAPSLSSRSIDSEPEIPSHCLESAAHDPQPLQPLFPLLPVHLLLIAFCHLAAPHCPSINEAFADELQPRSSLNSESISQPSPLRNLLSAFDSFEVLPSGKKLPKDYLATAREVVRSLRDSLGSDSSSESGFRRSADTAKTAIRNYIGSWKNSPLVSGEVKWRDCRVCVCVHVFVSLRLLLVHGLCVVHFFNPF